MSDSEYGPPSGSGVDEATANTIQKRVARMLEDGWRVTLTTDRDVSETDMDKIVSDIPEWMRGNCEGKQSWGYSLAADVRLDAPREIRCSGSCSMSGQIAAGWCEAMARRLEHIGCKVVIGEMSG